MKSTVDTQKPNNELLDDANQDTNPSAGIISEKINARFVKKEGWRLHLGVQINLFLYNIKTRL